MIRPWHEHKFTYLLYCIQQNHVSCVQIAALRYIPSSVSWSSFALVFGLAAASVIAAVYLSSKK